MRWVSQWALASGAPWWVGGFVSEELSLSSGELMAGLVFSVI